jgi:hypothetical protein
MIDYTNLPYLHIDAEPIKDIAPLSNSDSDLHISSSINFNYYSPSDFKENEYIIDLISDNSESFAAIHCSIRSLSANYDSLVNLFSQLHFSFNIIGITETKIKLNEVKLVNADLPGYCFLSQP